MPSLLDIRRRIRAVKSTQQITKAMKMVAASKLRRAQDRIQHGRPFAAQMLRVLNRLSSRVDAAAHPLLDERKTPRAGGRALLFVITADRGLCGSFNANVIKAAAAFITEQPSRQVALGLVGRRGRDYFAKRGFEIRYERINLFAKLHFDDGADIAHLLRARAGGLDWQRLIQRFEPHWRVLLSHLVLFGFVYPSERGRIPAWTMAYLMGRLTDEWCTAGPTERICCGTLLSRAQYLVDVETLGYRDARSIPGGTMTADEVAEWTAAIDARTPTVQDPDENGDAAGRRR